MVPVWAVGMVKDEADIIEGTLRHLADEALAGIIVADNGSTDDTAKILDTLELDCELVVVEDSDPAYYQSHKMTHLARLAAERGAEWIVPFDADELWIAADRLGVILRDVPDNVNIASARLFNHFPSAIDVDDPDPFRSIVWRQGEPAQLPKVAFRWHPDASIHQGNHGVDLPDPLTAELFEVRHFPYRSAEQFIRKARNGAAAYAATDLPEDVGAHWRGYGLLLERYGETAVANVFREHFWFLAPFESGLVRDPAPFMRWR